MREDYCESYMSVEAKVGTLKRILEESYKDDFSITQELLQNADDAGAENVQIGFLTNFSQEHPLAAVPGIYYANDGLLTKRNLHQIFAIGSSDKLADDDKIGKFGLGMKSVFHICEAFFIFALQVDGDLKGQERSEMFDPWGSKEQREELRIIRPVRHNWREKFNANRQHLFADISKAAGRDKFAGKNWFCVWLPLRTRDQSHKPFMSDFFPNIQEQYAVISSEDYRLRIAKMLPFMKHLKRIEVSGLNSGDTHEISIFTQRRLLGGNGFLDGEITLKIPLANNKMCIVGEEFLSQQQRLQDLRNSDDWPWTVAFHHDENKYIEEKNTPHYAIAAQGREVAGDPKLEIQHCVFLPLSDKSMREEVNLPPNFPYSISIYLHANMFVDAGRQKFELPNHDTRDSIKLQWNKAIFEQNLLPDLIPVLSRMLADKHAWFNKNLMGDLIEKIAETDFYRCNAQFICSRHVYVNILNEDGWKWLQLPSGDRLLEVPETIIKIPALVEELLKIKCGVFYLNASRVNLISSESAYLCRQWPQTDINSLLEVIVALPEDVRYQKEILDFLLDFFADKPELLSFDFIKSYLLEISSNNYLNLYEKLIALLRPGQLSFRIIQVNADFRERSAFTFWQEIIASTEHIIPLPVEISSRPSLTEGNSRYSRKDTDCFLQILENKFSETRITESVKSFAVNFACDLIEFSEVELSDNLLVRRKIIQIDQRLYSWHELRQENTFVFTTGGEPVRNDMQKLIPSLNMVFLQDKYVKAVNSRVNEKISAFKLDDVAKIFAKRPHIKGDSGLRIAIVKKLKPVEKYFKIIRYILHRNRDYFDYDRELWIPDVNAENETYDVWLKLLEALQKTKNVPQLPIAKDIIESIPPGEYNELKIKRLDREKILQEMHQSINLDNVELCDLDFGWVTKNTYKIILNDDKVQADEKSGCLQKLPLFPKRGGGFTAINDDTFIEKENRLIPDFFLTKIHRLDIVAEMSEKIPKQWINRVWSVGNYLEYAKEFVSEYSQMENFCLEMRQALEWLAEERRKLSDENKDFLRRQKIFRLHGRSNILCSSNDILTISKSDLGQNYCLSEYGFYYAAEVDLDCFSEQIRDYLQKNLFLQKTEIGEIVAERLAGVADFFAGQCLTAQGEIDDYDVDDFIKVFEKSNDMPIAILLKSLQQQGVPDNDLLETLSKNIPADRLIKICNYLAEKAKPKPENIFWKHYLIFLRQVIKIADYKAIILPEIKLFNSKGELRGAAGLTHGANNVPLDWQLHRNLAEIIPQALQRTTEADAGKSSISKSSMPSFNDSRNLSKETWKSRTGRFWDDITSYFRHWEDFSLKSFVGVLIVLADNSEQMLQKVKKRFLDLSYENFLNLLNPDISSRDQLQYNCQAFMDLYEDGKVRTANLLDEIVEIPLASLQEMENLIVGEEHYSCCAINGYDGYSSFFLGLRKLDKDDLQVLGKECLKKLLKNTCEKIFARNGLKKENYTLEKVWQHLEQETQFALEAAQIVILEDLISSLRRLKPNHQLLQEKLKELDTLKNSLAQAQVQRNSEGVKRAWEKCEDIKVQIRDLFVDNDSVAGEMLTSLSSTMLIDYGYGTESIVPELFQNADDASTEYLAMISKLRDEIELSFIVQETAEAINVMHWGRPINKHAHGDYADGIEQGFNNDLRKMMLLSYSDKDNAAIERTGKFGLGFKSVYLICNRPLIHSGELMFSVRGGIYPLPATEEEGRKLNTIIDELSPKVVKNLDHLLPAPTLLHLPTDGKEQIDFEKVLEQAPLLCIFAKSLSVVHILRSECPPAEFTRQKMPGKGLYKQEFGKKKFFVFNLEEGQVVFACENDQFVALEDDIPTIWITTPTQYKLSLGFALNANFTTDIGRSNLNLNDRNNLEKAGRLARQFASTLVNAFNNEADKTKLASLWEVMTRNFKTNALHQDQNNSRSPAGILRKILWGTYVEPGGYGSFINKIRAIPTGLPGNNFLKLSEIRYYLGSGLANQQIVAILSDVLQKQDGGKHVDLSATVSHQVYDKIKTVYRDFKATELTFASLLNMLCCINDKEADDALVNKVPWEELHEIVDDQGMLYRVCENWYFKNAAGEYRPWQELLSAKMDVEQQLICGFAPEACKLNENYKENSVFLMKFLRNWHKRKNWNDSALMSGNSERIVNIANWFFQAANDGQRKAAALYIIEGDEGIKVAAKVVTNPQFNEVLVSSYSENLNANDKEFFIATFRAQIQKNAIGDVVTQPYFDNGFTEDFDGSEDIISDSQNLVAVKKREINWFQWQTLSESVKQNLIAKTNRKFYGADLLSPFPATAENFDDRSRWMELFILAMTFSLGRVRDEQRAGFIKFCKSKKWFDVFVTAPVEDNRLEWLRVLEESVSSDDERYRYMMSLLPGIYQVSLYMENYVRLLMLWKTKGLAENMNMILRFRSSRIYRGVPCSDLPSLLKVLGEVGRHWFLRELIRSGTIHNRSWYQFCFVPSAENIELVFPDEIDKKSEEFYRFFEGLAGLQDSTFDWQFDAIFPYLELSDD